MARCNTGLLAELASLPWYVGAVVGVAAYGLVRLVGGMFAPLAWVFLVVCWLAALVSFLRDFRRRRLLETRTGLDSLAGMDWREFEMLVGEAFRRRGFAV